MRSTDTYGKLPERLVRDGATASLALDVRSIWLGKYVSFRDEVRVEDISRGFEAAVQRELKDVLKRGDRFACITHSTGGPVIRDWWNRYYIQAKKAAVPAMSHLIMLAPANFGSALAQLGKSRLSRIKTWFQGVEPGTGVLNWLELGSSESWELNRAWIESRSIVELGVFPFVLMGQTIDRKLYDHVNSYTGEPGSDGVVRVAAANLNSGYVRLEQEPVRTEKGKLVAPRLEVKANQSSPVTALKILEGRSHSGADIGIIRSVRNDGKPHPTVTAVLDCLRIESPNEYGALCARFTKENQNTQDRERVEVHKRILIPDSVTITDRYTMVVFRVRDNQGASVGEFDLKLLASPSGATNIPPSPDLLPQGFCSDRQRNSRDSTTVTYYLNSDVMSGFPELKRADPAAVVRTKIDGAGQLGFRVEPHVTDGFVHFLPAELDASPEVLEAIVKPNQTTLVDIVMRRVVREGVFRLIPLGSRSDRDFSKEPPGDPFGG